MVWIRRLHKHGGSGARSSVVYIQSVFFIHWVIEHKRTTNLIFPPRGLSGFSNGIGRIGQPQLLYSLNNKLTDRKWINNINNVKVFSAVSRVSCDLESAFYHLKVKSSLALSCRHRCCHCKERPKDMWNRRLLGQRSFAPEQKLFWV